MRYLILLLMTILFSCGQTGTENNLVRKSLSDSLSPFDVIVYHGDEAVEKLEINVYIRDNKFYADNVFPTYSINGSKSIVWTVELDNYKILNCIKFIQKAKALPKECPNNSTSITEYIISFSNDTVKINGNCQWDTLDFFQLRKILFKENYAEEAQKKVNQINNLNKKLFGKWYYKPLTSEPKRGEYLILTKTNEFNSECFWEFGNEYLFKSSCNKFLDLTYSDKYEWQVDEDIYFKIQPGIIKDINGSMTVGNYDATFILDTLTDNELKLKFLWR